MAETKLFDEKYRSRLVQTYVWIMFGAYPFLYHDFYYDIVTCKYICYLVITSILLVLLLSSVPENFFKGLSFKKTSFRACDYFVMGFLLVNVISVIFSENWMYAMTGADGRNMGLFTVLLMCVVYFVLSHCYVHNVLFYYALSMGSIGVSLLGILNFLDVDLLGFYKGLVFEQKVNYISTLGHVDVYTSYFALTIPMLYIIYLTTDVFRLRVISFLALVISICGMVAGQCDSGYIILGASFVLAVVLIKGKQRYSVFLLPMVISTVMVKLMFYINDNMLEKREISRFAHYVYHDNVCMILFMIFSICVLMECFRITDMRHIWKIVLGVAVFIGIAYIIAVYVFTFVLTHHNLGSMEGVLRLNDGFGSYRGYIWRLLMEDYGDMNLLQKVFGIGTDALRPYLTEKYGESMYVVTNAYYDNAHNELIQYLITNGLAGVIMYLGMIGSTVIQGIKTFCNELDIHKKIILSGIICYVVQSLVNINQVVTTPLFFILLGCFYSDNDRLSKNVKKV